ncbi:MAG TPA: ABC transporter substrate-binding protein [Acetobacteraceae bacterium]|jgi:peptide/nickel transport system substrate-binding protein|nr:ABC transporter substrate-binding protein [Acetobacteraceae bacterium]
MTRIRKLLLAGCAAVALQASAAWARNTDVGTPREETLIVDMLSGRVSNPTQMNPFVEGVTISQGLHQLVLGQLWDIDTTTGKQFPDMAATMPEALDDSLTKFRFKVRDNLAWSDGVPFTASDVVFTAKMLIGNPKLPIGVYLKNLIKDIRAPDSSTVEIDTNARAPKLAIALGSTIYGNLFRIVPEHVWKDVEPATFNNYPPVGIGPYKLKTADPNGYWFLWEKRQDWQKTDAGAIKGEPKPNYVLFRAYGPEEKRVLAAAQNDLDILTDVTPESLDILRARNKYVRAWLDHFPWADFDDPCERGIHFNVSRPPYDKWQVRWALALATNLQKVSMATFSGMLRASPLGAPPTTLVQKTFHKPLAPWLASFALPDGYKPFDPDYAPRLAAALVKDGVDDIPTDPDAARDLFGVGWWTFDPAEAQKLLESVGYKKNGNAWTTPDGKPWKITINAPSNFEVESQRLAFAVSNEWRAFGIDVSVQQMEAGPFFTVYASGEFDAGSYWSSSCAIGPDLYVRLEGWNGRYVRPTGTPTSFNRERLADPDVTKAVDQLTAMPTDDPAIVAHGDDLLKALVKQLPAIEMFGTSKFVPVNTYYWDNYPTANNFYEGPWWWWSNFKFMVPEFKSTGRK